MANYFSKKGEADLLTLEEMGLISKDPKAPKKAKVKKEKEKKAISKSKPIKTKKISVDKGKLSIKAVSVKANEGETSTAPTGKAKSTNLTCSKCGTIITPGFAFCPCCGKRINIKKVPKKEKEPEEVKPGRIFGILSLIFGILHLSIFTPLMVVLFDISLPFASYVKPLLPNVSYFSVIIQVFSLILGTVGLVFATKQNSEHRTMTGSTAFVLNLIALIITITAIAAFLLLQLKAWENAALSSGILSQ